MSQSIGEAADKLFASLPCATDDHFPFRLIKGGDSSGIIFYGAVRLNSFPWDGGGGRTDLPDIFGLMWAAAPHRRSTVGSCSSPSHTAPR